MIKRFLEDLKIIKLHFETNFYNKKGNFTFVKSLSFHFSIKIFGFLLLVSYYRETLEAPNFEEIRKKLDQV
jgi:hypothetical protein